MTATERIRIWPVLLAALLGFAMLCGLGLWQVQRLQWKQGLLAQLAARAASEPVDLAAAEAEFTKVRFRATYKFDSEKRLISAFDGGPGWNIVTPAITADGRAVLVDRGQVPPERLERYDRPRGEVEILGVVRVYRNGRGRFDPGNDPARNQWYWWDIPAMLAASKLPASVDPLPFAIQILPGTVTADLPRPVNPKAGLVNNHLGYAISWFGLALALLAVAGVYVRGQVK